MAYTVGLINILLIISTHSSNSLNQPNFTSCAIWSPVATTFVNESWVGRYPIGIFINEQNSVYVTNRDNSSIFVWQNGTIKIIPVSVINPSSLFVTTSNDIYVDNGYSNGGVDRWMLNATIRLTVMKINGSCTGLFVDIYNSLYCSLADKHRVFKRELLNNANDPIITVAGTPCPGPVANMLDHPHGIFVDNNLNLYVADSHNNRVQRFASGQPNAMTIAGFGATMSFLLNKPTSVVLDANDNLFIVDSYNHRIIRTIADEFQCLVGCSGESGTSANLLHNPQTMAFDTFGNIFVTDSNNHRVQKFSLIKNSCVTTSSTSTTTTIEASLVAYSSLKSFCGCSGFSLSLSNISFNIDDPMYQWQSSPTGQNIWSNINTSNSSSLLYISSQVYSSDYRCQITVLYPSPMNLTSTIVTVMSTTNISYCQTLLVDCASDGDDINNFILFGELGTQINDLDTNCSVDSYDNRTEESVSLYENTNYTAQASTQYRGDERLAIWIDFNNNFQFESSEKVAYQPRIRINNTNVTVVIPSSSAGATVGIHRMRATLAYSSVPDSCGGADTFGETHDYTVNILPLG